MFRFLFIIACGMLVACGEKDNSTPSSNDLENVVSSVEKQITIDASQMFQTIRGFGASDCWMADFVGHYWPGQREKIARLLFSTQWNGAEAEGIGLTQWRVNLGGGSAEQGDESGIEDKTRRASTYLNADGSYNWSRCSGQRYFMKQATELGCPSIVLFSNSPPIFFTRNGKGFSNSGGASNLRSDAYDNFAEYMAEVARYYRTEGYPITHISPVNEPQYNWDGGQEGSGWKNVEVATLLRSLDRALINKNLDIDILPGEAGDWEYLYRIKGDADRSRVIEDFYTPESPAYIGNLKHVRHLICGHSYWTDGDWEGMRKVRQKVANVAVAMNLELWQSEWSMLGDGYSNAEFPGFDKASEMDIALYMSKVIHNDLTIAGVSSWSFWTAMDVARWGHKNRFLLISLLPAAGVYDDIEHEGTFVAMPTLWILGNYSRFIRPGYQRISVKYNESAYFFGSAWIAPDKKDIVAVFTNLSDKGVRLNDIRNAWPSDINKINTYVTRANKPLTRMEVQNNHQIILEPKSVTTIIYQLK